GLGVRRYRAGREVAFARIGRAAGPAAGAGGEFLVPHVHTASRRVKLSRLISSCPWLSSQKRCIRLPSTSLRYAAEARMSEIGWTAARSAAVACCTAARVHGLPRRTASVLTARMGVAATPPA